MAETNYTALRRHIDAGRKALEQQQYAQAFSILRTVAAIAPDLQRQIDDAESRYFYMLRYLTAGNNVTGINDTLGSVANDIKRLLRMVELRTIAAADSTVYSGRLRFAALRPEETLESLVSDYLARHDAIATDTHALTDVRRRAPLERLAHDIFYRLWIEYPFTDDTMALTASIINDSTLPVYDRVMWIAALGLSLAGYADSDVMHLLLNIADTDEDIISTAAIVWLRLATEGSDLRDEAMRLISLLHPDDISDVTMEWLRSLGTDKMAHDLADNMGPRMARLGRDLQQQLLKQDPDALLENMKGANMSPEDFEMLKHMQEAQQRGDDILFGAAIKSVADDEFFRQLPNWFMTFHVNNSALADIVDGAGFAFGDIVGKMHHLCDVDKFAMLLQLKHLPAGAREDALGHMADSFHSLGGDIDFDQMLGPDTETTRRELMNRHIKNIYRFFNVFGGRGEFRNPLAQTPDADAVIECYRDNFDVLAEIAHQYYIHHRYEAAVKVYDRLDTLTLNNTEHPELTVAQLTEHAHSLHALGRKQQFSLVVLSLEQYANGENAFVQQLLAADYYHNRRYADALSALLPLDLNGTADVNTKNDIGWLMTIIGHYDTAEPYFDSATAGWRHAVLLWLTGRREQALAALASVNTDVTLDPDDKAAIQYIVDNAPMGPSLPLMQEILTYRRNGSPFGSI